MPKAATGFYAVCKGHQIGVFTTWDEAQPHVIGFPGAKFKKFRTQSEAEQWYKTNLPKPPRTSTATPNATTASTSNVIYTTSNTTAGTTHAPSRPLPPSVTRAVTAPAPGPVQPPRVAAPKNTTIDIVYSDGACKGNGAPGSVAGVGVWWGPNDRRNISERCPGPQTNNRAELVAIARVLETAPRNTNTLIIRTDSTYSRQALTEWSYKWRKNGWKTSSGKAVLNQELIDYTLTLLETRQRSGQPVQIEYVKGHSGDAGNDGADALAVAGCAYPEIPEKDWVGLKVAYCTERDTMDDFVNINPDEFILSEEELMKELENY